MEEEYPDICKQFPKVPTALYGEMNGSIYRKLLEAHNKVFLLNSDFEFLGIPIHINYNLKDLHKIEDWKHRKFYTEVVQKHSVYKLEKDNNYEFIAFNDLIKARTLEEEVIIDEYSNKLWKILGK